MRYEWFSPQYSRYMMPSENDENYDEWIKQWKRHGKWARFLHCSCIIDGYNKYPFHFKTSVRFPMQPFEYKEVSSSLKDLMYQRAEELKDMDNTIQFLWSGGVDSTAALLVLKDVCSKDQLLVQLTPTSIEENHVIWNRLVKNLSHDVYTGEHLYEVTNTQNVVVECGSADHLYGSDGATTGPAEAIAKENNFNLEHIFESPPWNFKRRWYIKRRFGNYHKRYRFFRNNKEDILNLDNIQPFYDGKHIEQYFMNRAIDGTMTFHLRNDETYLKEKKELRDIIREYDVSVGDSLLAKTSALGSESSLRRMLIRSSKYPKGKDPLFRVAAITETGKIITRDDMIKKTPTAWGSPTIGLE